MSKLSPCENTRPLSGRRSPELPDLDKESGLHITIELHGTGNHLLGQIGIGKGSFAWKTSRNVAFKKRSTVTRLPDALIRLFQKP
jgi:hypothetical protein